jgi:hypothetical protein
MEHIENSNVGASLAVEMWMDYGPRQLPPLWKTALLSHGVGCVREDGNVALTSLSWKYESFLSQLRRGSWQLLKQIAYHNFRSELLGK